MGVFGAVVNKGVEVRNGVKVQVGVNVTLGSRMSEPDELIGTKSSGLSGRIISKLLASGILNCTEFPIVAVALISSNIKRLWGVALISKGSPK